MPSNAPKGAFASADLLYSLCLKCRVLSGGKHIKLFQQVLSWALALQLSGAPVLLAQPVLIQPGNPFNNQKMVMNGVENLRVAQQGPDGVEAELTMDYSYDGFGGPTARIVPVIGKKGQKGISAWFGSDPGTIGRGRGTVTLRVRYFNDEPGVPATFTSDQIQILILNQTGTAIIAGVPFLKTITWGNPNARGGNKQEPTLAAGDAQRKRDAEQKARLEVAARERARLQAEAEAKAHQEAEAKARAEMVARDEAQKKAQAEAARIALENQKAEEARLAQAKLEKEKRQRAEAEERARKEAETKALAEAQAKAAAEAKARADAEAKALADSKAREEAKQRALAEAKRKEEERKVAEAKRIADEKAAADAKALAQAKALAEAQAREEARLRAEAEAKRLAEEKRAAEERALAEARARKDAEEKAYQEALAQAKAELEAKKLADAPAQSPATAPTTADLLTVAQDKKTKVTNVDVVNRSIDRTQMTFGVEFEYKDQLSDPMLGVDVLRESEPEVSRYFVSQPAEIGKSRRNFALLPVKFAPPATLQRSDNFGTDKVMVYLTDKRSQRYNIYPATMLLRWHASGEKSANPAGNGIEIEDFKQNDPSNGSVTVRYNLLSGKGRLRAKVYDSGASNSAAYFTSSSPSVQAGGGLQLVDVQIDAEAKPPGDLVRADTIEVELVDLNGKVLARTTRKAAMVWVRPK